MAYMNRQKLEDSSVGFTLLELLVTMALMLVLFGTAALSLAPLRSSLHLSSAVQQVATDLRLTRMKAISQNSRFQISFVGTTYTIQKCVPTCTDQSGAIVLPEGITVSASTTPQFLPRGTSGGAATITVSNGTKDRQVEVTPVGRVKVL